MAAPEQSFSADVCIVGAGPAGITIAREFSGGNARICLVESGGDAVAPEVQELARGQTFGDPIHAPDNVCTRAFGGNSKAWSVDIGNRRLGVRYMPLDDMDFEKRDWMPFSGWPFAKSHLLPFYQRAQVVCQSGPFAYDPDTWETEHAKRSPLDGAELQTSMFQFGPADVFHSQYKQELTDSQNVQVLRKTTVIEIECDAEAKAVTRVLCVGENGGQFWIEAKIFVIATGGFENARLLLMSNRQQPCGIGNQNDVVGRYFNDHPLVYGGALRPFDREAFNRMALYDLRQVNGFPVMAHFKLSNEVSRKNELINISASVFPRPSDRGYYALHAFQQLKYELMQRKRPEHLFQLSGRVIKGFDSVVKATALHLQSKKLVCTFSQGGWSALPRKAQRYQAFTVMHQIEQTPEPCNRVALGRDRDALGCPTLEVHWRWSRDDAERVARAQKLMAAEFQRSGVGEFVIKTSDGLPNIDRPSGSHHLIGTTRMHDNPKLGVVDADCAVHGMPNLFLAGSSTFPTGGYANPTLTIVALALRLADHLKAQLRALATPLPVGQPAESAVVQPDRVMELATPVPA